MHILPQLRKLEEKYGDVLAVIGVHSAKFPAERTEAGLRDAVRRYEIHHPVANDADFRVWSEYAVRAWPSIYFIDPRGKIVAKHAGELDFEQFDAIISAMVEEYDREQLLDRTPVSFQLESPPEGPLAFPGKVRADEESSTLFIADTNHNRVLEADLDGTVRRVWGNGEQGMSDGDAESATFNHPQGMALRGTELYVADTESHAVRLLDLATGQVRRVAGTGKQARGYAPGGAPGRQADLSSPWDLCIVNDVLYIAMAGTHQIWSMEMSTRLVRPFAGSGREGIQDGPASTSWLAQPSGLSTDGALIYFADSETSAIRVLNPSSGSVQTIVGLGLFEFGDVDGTGGMVRLQHPLGVCYYDGQVYIADTYNHKIKRLEVASRAVSSWLGSGEAGFEDGAGPSAGFHEPSGLSAAAGRLYVADTNNHLIRVVDVASGNVSTLQIQVPG